MQSPSKTAYADAVLARADLDQGARTILEPVRREWQNDPRDVLTRSQRNRVLGCGSTRGRQLEQEGLPAYLTGERRRVTPTELVYIYKINQILASFPSDGPPMKARGGPVIMARAKAALLSRVEPIAHPRRSAPVMPEPVMPEPVMPAPNPVRRGRGRPRKIPIKPELAAEA